MTEERNYTIKKKDDTENSYFKEEENDATGTKIKKKIALEALRQNLGIIAAACRAAKINRRLFYEWKNNDKEFAEAIKEIEEEAIDFSEGHLLKLIKKGNPAANIFHLKCKGKSRGYIEKVQIESSGNLNINMSKLTDEQLHAIASGKSISGVGTSETSEG